MKNILHSNNKIAEQNRVFLSTRNICAVNILASPGAGKTSLLIKLIGTLKDKVPLAVIEGDIAGSIDAEAIDKVGIPVVQINTGGGCHLDANMFKEALESLVPPNGAVVFIENVGNLVCPASFDLGETVRMTVANAAEGSDKPIKYPLAFQTADIIVLNKIDLIEYTNFDRDFFYKAVDSVSDKKVFEASCTKNIGIEVLAEEIMRLCKK